MSVEPSPRLPPEKRQRTAALQKLAHLPTAPEFAKRLGVGQSAAALAGPFAKHEPDGHRCTFVEQHFLPPMPEIRLTTASADFKDPLNLYSTSLS
jgi:hypothetical protein